MSEPALCTTAGEPVEQVRAEREWANGFVRPYRDHYTRAQIVRCQATEPSTDIDPHQCILQRDHDGDHEFDAFMIMEGRPIEFMRAKFHNAHG